MNMNVYFQPVCIECGVEMFGSQRIRRFCSTRCKARWWKKNPSNPREYGHHCRACGKHFSIGPGQHNKWLCSDACRRARNAESARTFHLRRPQMEAIYRARTKEKLPPDSQNRRFYSVNQNAPRACESCGENRVLDIAHKPGHERFGARRLAAKLKWPEMVWVLCPTCHCLLDRIRYTPAELGLKP
jgi:hypothetical protein